MTFLVDTNVLSEGVKRIPNADVVAWLDEADEDRTFLSVMTVSEIRYGIERLPHGLRKSGLAAWLDDLVFRFSDHLLPVDLDVAEHLGRLLARMEEAGRRAGGTDAVIAATALVHDLTVVTRNGKDFEPAGVRVIDPWVN